MTPMHDTDAWQHALAEDSAAPGICRTSRACGVFKSERDAQRMQRFASVNMYEDGTS